MPRLTAEARRALVEERKTQILNAAAKVFAQRGFERATIAEIAREAGVAEGSIYNYFKNKGDLLVSIPRQIVAPAIQPLQAEMTPSAAAEHLTPEQMLSLLARNVVAVVTHNAHIIRVVFSSLPTMNPATRDKFLQQVPLFATGILESYFRQQVEAGVFRAELNPAIAARIFPGMLLTSLILQEIFQIQPSARFAYDEVTAQAVRIFLHGALAPTPSPSPVAKRSDRGGGHRRKRR